MRRRIGRHIYVLMLCGLIAACLAAPTAALGADDCPPPSEQPFVDPGFIEGDNLDTGGGDGSQNDTGEVEEDSGVLGSLGNVSSGQLTMGIMVVVGVIVGVAYLLMVSRMDADDEE